MVFHKGHKLLMSPSYLNIAPLHTPKSVFEIFLGQFLETCLGVYSWKWTLEETQKQSIHSKVQTDLNDVVSCTSLGGINIRMLGFVIQVIIYILRTDQERLRKMQHKVLW